MKKEKIVLGIVIILCLSFIVLASNNKLDVTIENEEVSLTEEIVEDAFILSADENFILNGKDIENLYLIMDGDNQGVYYNLPDETELIKEELGDEDYFEIIINNVNWALFQSENLEDFAYILDDFEEEDNIDLDSFSYTFVVTIDKWDMLEVESDSEEGYILTFLEDKFLFVNEENSVLIYDEFPEVLKFKRLKSLEEYMDEAEEAKEQAQEMVTEKAKQTGIIMDSDEDCVDIDADEDNSFEVPSFAYNSDGEFLVDRCQYDADLDKFMLAEAICTEEGKLKKEQVYCAEGQICKAGRCVGDETSSQEPYCLDTDQNDNFENLDEEEFRFALETKGATVGFYSSENDENFGLWVDYCATPNMLIEYSCMGERVKFTNIHCECEEGRCVSLPMCYVTDGGDNPNVQGKVMVLNDVDEEKLEIFQDNCNDDGDLVEYFCDISQEQGYDFREVTCSINCEEGSCSESDFTLNVDGLREDLCNADNDCEIGEICVDTSCREGCNDDISCPIGKKCVDNECVVESEDYELDDINEKLNRRLNKLNAIENVVDKLLRESGVDPNSVIGSYPGDQVVIDLQNQLKILSWNEVQYWGKMVDDTPESNLDDFPEIQPEVSQIADTQNNFMQNIMNKLL